MKFCLQQAYILHFAVNEKEGCCSDFADAQGGLRLFFACN